MRLRDEQGMMAIGVALMLIVVLPLFGGALWQYSMAEMRRLERTEQDLHALFLARAGAEMVMGAWKQELDSDNRPFGVMNTIYYDVDSESFTTKKPANYLGTIDVEVRKEDASKEGEARATVIEATATVGATKRTVRLVTYPHRYGHDPSLLWYNQNTGESPHPESAEIYKEAEDLVVMRTNTREAAIHLGTRALSFISSSPDRSATITATDLVFDSPLKLMRSESAIERSPRGEFNLVFEAERIFFAGFEIAYLPEASFILDYPSKHYSVVLSLPEIDDNGKSGELGADIKDMVAHGNVISSARYGQVYFDDSPVVYKAYEWYRWFEYFVIPRINIREKNGASKNLGLSGQAFYFKEGSRFDPLEIQKFLEKGQGNTVQTYFQQAADDGWLLPIKTEYQINRADLESLKPFFWEQ